LQRLSQIRPDRSLSYLSTSPHALLTFSFAFFPTQNDTLMCYLLDELHSYETDFSDALGPTSHEATASFAGEAVLLCPVTTEALHMTHAVLTMDMATLHKDVMNIGALQVAMAENICQRLNDVTNLINNALAPSLRTMAPPLGTNGECMLLTPPQVMTDYSICQSPP